MKLKNKAALSTRSVFQVGYGNWQQPSGILSAVQQPLKLVWNTAKFHLKQKKPEG